VLLGNGNYDDGLEEQNLGQINDSMRQNFDNVSNVPMNLSSFPIRKPPPSDF